MFSELRDWMVLYYVGGATQRNLYYYFFFISELLGRYCAGGEFFLFILQALKIPLKALKAVQSGPRRSALKVSLTSAPQCHACEPLGGARVKVRGPPRTADIIQTGRRATWLRNIQRDQQAKLNTGKTKEKTG